jgi:hypothetical protein
LVKAFKSLLGVGVNPVSFLLISSHFTADKVTAVLVILPFAVAIKWNDRNLKKYEIDQNHTK